MLGKIFQDPRRKLNDTVGSNNPCIVRWIALVAVLAITGCGLRDSHMLYSNAFQCFGKHIEFNKDNVMQVYSADRPGLPIYSAKFKLVDSPEGEGNWFYRLDFESAEALGPLVGGNPVPLQLYVGGAGGYGARVKPTNGIEEGCFFGRRRSV